VLPNVNTDDRSVRDQRVLVSSCNDLKSLVRYAVALQVYILELFSLCKEA
jgi:hypothetical protein